MPCFISQALCGSRLTRMKRASPRPLDLATSSKLFEARLMSQPELLCQLMDVLPLLCRPQLAYSQPVKDAQATWKGH